MKPAFALSFSATGISLLHHSDDEWYEIGAVALNAPDLAAGIDALRDKAFAIENDLSCKLIMPVDQVRYLSLPTDGLDPEELTRQVETALAEATPYDLGDLAYDSATIGPVTYVAATARETLDEAQSFATQHGFQPVQFSATATDEEFPHEPVFVVAHNLSAPELLPEPEPEPDSERETPATLPVHNIADTAAPNVFRAPEAEPARTAATRAPSRETALRLAIPAIAAGVCVGVGIGLWSLIGAEGDGEAPTLAESDLQSPAETTATAAAEDSALDPAPDPEVEIATVPQIPASEDQPELSATDAAILEALNVPPTPVEQVARDPETQQQLETLAGTVLTAPIAPIPPEAEDSEEIYLSSLDRSDLSSDAIALPALDSFDTDIAPITPAPTGVEERQFELDERGLVTPTPEGALNPDGVVVYLGSPPSVPPEAPVRFEDAPEAEEAEPVLVQKRPRLRPEKLVENFERQNLGGRSLEELRSVRPKLRPESLQVRPQIDDTPTALAVVRVPRPKLRPARLAAASSGSTNRGSTAAIAQGNDDAGSFQPKSVAPKIPSTASVARQATLDNALNLRRLNLIGVYGTPSNRRALVRLPSGRYKKLKVGDRIDGGKVVAIGDSELRYQKKGRNVTLSMPRG